MDDHRSLVQDGSRGDARALDALFSRHLPGVLAYVRAHAGARLLAHDSSFDLVQSACREVLKDLPGHDYRDEAGFRNWLYLAAERKILDRARYHGRAKRDPPRDPRQPADLSSREIECLRVGFSGFWSPSSEAAAKEELARVEEALARLPEDYREIIVLARIVGLSHAELAARLSRSEGAVRVLLHRALARLAVETSPPESEA